MAMMRLFIAIDLPSEVCKTLVQIQQQIANMQIIEGSYTRPEQLHITLKFIGAVDEALIPQIIERLKKIDFKAFTSRLKHLGAFHPRSNTPVMWLSVEETSVSALAQCIENALADIVPRSNKALANHITIARAKNVLDKKKFTQLLRDFKIEPQLPFWISEFVLKSSITHPQGAEHTIIERFALH